MFLPWNHLPVVSSDNHQIWVCISLFNYFPSYSYFLYREVHLLANLGWDDFDFVCSTLCPVPPGLMGNWQNWLSIWARWWNISNQSQLNRGSPGAPCIVCYVLTFIISFDAPSLSAIASNVVSVARFFAAFYGIINLEHPSVTPELCLT